ncbi:MAG: tripartite tricarboxylate transporter permease, partial [Enterococcus casseliflavus]
PQVAWGLIASMFIGNLMLLALNMPLVRIFAKIIETPKKYLLPIFYVQCWVLQLVAQVPRIVYQPKKALLALRLQVKVLFPVPLLQMNQ